jgi:hypothetical protein
LIGLDDFFYGRAGDVIRIPLFIIMKKPDLEGGGQDQSDQNNRGQGFHAFWTFLLKFKGYGFEKKAIIYLKPLEEQKRNEANY